MLTKKQALGLRIKELREKLKLTQDKLAELVNIDPKHLSRIENGRNYPSFETLEKLVENLDTTFEDIFQFEHIETREVLIDKIINSLQAMPDKQLKFIYKMIKEL